MKDFIYGLFQIITDVVMQIPCFWIRKVYLKIFLKQFGQHTEICRCIDLRSPHRISIGSNSSINKHVVLDGRGGLLIIGDCVDIAQDTKIWTLQHDYNSSNYMAVGGDIIIEDYVWLASGVTILPGIKIGKGAVVATGAVVTKDIPPYTVVAGIPAKKIGERNQKLNYSLGKHRWFH